MLETDFRETIQTFTSDINVPGTFWAEIALQHSHKSRHYHGLQHLESIWQQLQAVKAEIQDWPVMLFAIAYHDFVYDVKQSSNEVKSGEKAVLKMQSTRFEREQMNRCYRHIIATKGHTVSEDPDTNFFTDADLSILGSDPDVYTRYTENIRKEYRVYPSFMYKPGRKKVLQHFLHLPRIFKTDHFYKQYETQARINIKKEIQAL